MQKNMIQDVVPRERRTIRDVPIMNSKGRKREMEEVRSAENTERGPEPSFEEKFDIPEPPKSKPRSFKKFFMLVALLVILGFAVFVMTAFSSAKVSVEPKREIASVDLATSASKVPGSAPLVYEIIEARQETTKEVPATGEEVVEKKASGKIIIYNNYSKETQRLIARTRFQTPEGLVYRISESVVVPGMKEVGGKLEQSSIQVTVYADEAGEKYNIGKTDFTVPGFKDDAKRFSGFYAKSVTEMSGGFIGKMKKVSDADKAPAVESMKSALTESLNKELSAKVPEGYALVQGGVFYEFKELSSDSAGDNAVLKEEGVAKAIILEKSSLASLIAKESLESWVGLPAGVESFDKLTANFGQNPDLAADSLEVVLKGQAPMVALVDQKTVAEKLAGKPKSAMKGVLAEFPSVASAKASVKPIWKNSFPKDPLKIHINILSSNSD